MPGTAPPLRETRLGRLAQQRRPAPQERCELCGEPIEPAHRHVLEPASRELKCVCRACSLLFAEPGARFRLVPDRRRRLEGFRLDEVLWEELRLPVDMAFFVRSSAAGRVQAFYPSPMGPTESLLRLDAWAALEDANPVLRTLAEDVEALLVNRARGARDQWIVPIDDCYALVGLIRTRWRGFTGGAEVWRALAEFFEGLDDRRA